MVSGAQFPDWTAEGFRTVTDLENRTVAWTVIAVNSEETQPTIDGSLTFGIL